MAMATEMTDAELAQRLGWLAEWFDGLHTALHVEGDGGAEERTAKMLRDVAARLSAVPTAEELRKQKDAAYAERDKLVAALSKVFPACLGRHADDGQPWDEDWKWVVYIVLPTGQVSWHIHDSEVPMFSHLRRDPAFPWDGHTTEEKYERLAALASPASGAALNMADFDPTGIELPPELQTSDELARRIAAAGGASSPELVAAAARAVAGGTPADRLLDVEVAEAENLLHELGVPWWDAANARYDTLAGRIRRLVAKSSPAAGGAETPGGKTRGQVIAEKWANRMIAVAGSTLGWLLTEEAELARDIDAALASPPSPAPTGTADQFAGAGKMVEAPPVRELVTPGAEREAALEEAAGVAMESTRRTVPGQYEEGWNHACRIVASSIRALKSQPAPPDPIAALLPATFFADRPTAERVTLLVAQWQALAANAAGGEEGGWARLSERAPEPGDRVLICVVSGGFAPNIDTATWTGQAWQNYNWHRDREAEEIDFWRPLPAPPRSARPHRRPTGGRQ
jgi:hypothetical protein